MFLFNFYIIFISGVWSSLILYLDNNNFSKKHITLYQYIIYNVHIVILCIYNTHILMSRSKCSEDVEGRNIIKLECDQYNQSQERTQREKRRVKPYKTRSKSKVPSYLSENSTRIPHSLMKKYS